MEHEGNPPEPPDNAGEGDDSSQPPPFDPDPRLMGEIERGAKPDEATKQR